MAKKNNDLDFDDLDSDLDWDTGADPVTPANKKNTPIREVSLSFAAGARKQLGDVQFMRRVATNALPQGYGTAMDFASNVKDGIGELYDVAASELKPAQDTMRRLAKAALPKTKSILPAKFVASLEEFINGGEAAGKKSKEQEQNERITAELAEVFKTQMEHTAEEGERSRIEGQVRERAANKRHLDSARLLSLIGHGVDRLVSYNDQVVNRYQRKSLELQYRQLYTQTEMLGVFKETQLQQRVLLDAIMKNTALSEQEKLSIRHRAAGSVKDRMLNGFQGKSVKFLQNYGGQLVKNIGGRVREASSSFADAIMGMDSALDAGEMMDEMGVSKTGLAGEVAGSSAISALGRTLGRQVRKRINPNGKVAQTGAGIYDLIQNLPSRLNEFARGQDDDSSMFGWFKSMFRELLPQYQLSAKVNHSGLLDADKPASFDQLTRRSITEIIPRFLSEIHREIRVFRTGDESIGRMTYNLDRDTLTTTKDLRKDIQKRLIDKDSVTVARHQSNQLINSIDRHGTLSPKAREALAKQLAFEGADGLGFSMDRLSGDDPLRFLSGLEHEEVRELLQANFTLGDGSRDKVGLSSVNEEFNRMREVMPDVSSAMSAITDIYGIEQLEKLGYVKRHGRQKLIDHDRLFNDILSNPDFGGTFEASKEKHDPFANVMKQADGWVDKKLDPHFDRLENFLENDPRAKAARETVAKHGGNAKQKVKGWWNRARGKAEEAKKKYSDLYFKDDESTPALEATKLEAGDYVNVDTGEVLESWDDITGRVVDTYTGETVLATEEQAKSLVTENNEPAKVTFKQRVKSGISAVGERLGIKTNDAGVTFNGKQVIDKAKVGETLLEAEAKVIERLERHLGPITDENGNIAVTPEQIEHAMTGMSEKHKKEIHAQFEKARKKAEELKETTVGKGGILDRVKDRFNTVTGDARQVINDKIAEHRPQVEARVEQLQEQLETLRARAEEVTQNQAPGEAAAASNQELVDINRQQLEVLGAIFEAIMSRDFSGPGTEPSTGGRLKGLLGKGWGLTKGIGKGFWNYTKTVYNAQWSLAKFVGKGVTGAAGLLKNGLSDWFSDIYVEGESDPVLFAKKLRHGDYRDQKTGAKIKSLKDIKGAVVNEQNEVVLTAEQYAKGLYYTRKGKFVRLALNGAKGAASAVLGGYFQLFKLPFKVLGWAAKQVGGLFKGKVADVYVKGETKPRLLAFKIRDGEYWRVSDRKVIKTVNDIEGEIKNRNGETVLSNEDYEKGLVNQYGLPFGFLKNKLLGLGGRVIGAGAKLVGAAVDGVARLGAAAGRLTYSALAAPANWLAGKLKPNRKGLFTGWFGKNEGDPVLAALKQIHDLIDNRLPKPKRKYAKGSWQATKEEKVEEKKQEEAAKKDDTATSKLLNFFKGLGKKGGGFLSTLFGEDDEGGGDGDTTIIAGGGGGDGDGKDKDGKDKDKDKDDKDKDGKRRRPRGRFGRMWDATKGAAGSGWDKMKGLGGKVGLGSPGRMALGAAGALGGSYVLDQTLGEDSAARDVASTAGEVAGWGLTGASLLGMGKAALGWGAGATAASAATGATAATAAGAAGAAGTAAAGGGLMAGAGSLLGGAGAAVGGILGAPVVVVGAIAAGVGYVGWRGFKKYKYGTYTPMRAFRMAQYGYDYKDADQGKMISELEQLCEEHITQTPNGYDIKTSKDLNMNVIHEMFGIDDGWFTSNKEEREVFARWFNGRFKPIFLHWYTCLRQVDASTGLQDADDLDKEKKLNLIKQANTVSMSVYAVQQGAFDGEKVEVNPDQIKDAYILAVDSIENDGILAKTKRLADSVMTIGGPLNPNYWLQKWSTERLDEKRLEQLKEKQSETGAKVEEALSSSRVIAAMGGAAASTAASSAAAKAEAKPAAADTTAQQGILGRSMAAVGSSMAAVGGAISGAFNSAVGAVSGAMSSAGAALSGGAVAMIGMNGSVAPKARMAAELATRAAQPRSVGLCARYVANALQGAGYRFQRQGSAFMYATNGIMESMGFTKIPDNTPYQVGDVIVIDKTPQGKHGHIQIFNGTNWVSDFIQRSDNPYRQQRPRTLWRDMSASGGIVGVGARAGAALAGNVSAAYHAVTDRALSAGSNIAQGNYGQAMSDLAGVPGSAAGALVHGQRAEVPKLNGSAADLEKKIIEMARASGITDPQELASLLGQSAHESGNFSRLSENLNYSASRAAQIWPNRFRTVEAAQAALAGGPEGFAEHIYGGRMGNKNRGDAYKYRGRGPIQLTGRSMYEAFARWSGYDVVNNPDLVASDMNVAAKSVIFYWMTRVRGRARPTDINAVTKAINGGLNGLADRRAKTAGYLAKLGSMPTGDGVAAKEDGAADFSGVTASSSAPANFSGVTSTDSTTANFSGVSSSVAQASVRAAAGAPTATTAAQSSTPASAGGSYTGLGAQLSGLTEPSATPQQSTAQSAHAAEQRSNAATASANAVDTALQSSMGELVTVNKEQLNVLTAIRDLIEKSKKETAPAATASSSNTQRPRGTRDTETRGNLPFSVNHS